MRHFILQGLCRLRRPICKAAATLTLFLASSGAASAAEEEGVPLAFQADLALWSLVTFIIFVLLLKRFAWGPLIRGLDKRETAIRQDIAAAESARIKAEKMLAEHTEKLDRVQDEVKEILAEARRDAEQARLNIISDAQVEADAMTKRAVTEIQRAKDQALKELFDAMSEQVADATQHLLGRSLNGDDQNRLIEEALSEFSYRPV